MAVITQDPIGSSPSSILRIAGAFTAIFSLVMGMLVLFVIPSACTFLGGLELLILTALFVFGVSAFLVGTILSRKSRKGQAKQEGISN